MFLLRATFICIVGFLSLSTPVLAFQAQTVDSAKNQTTSEPQVAEIDQLLKECGDLIRKGRFANLTAKANEALKLSRILNDKYRMAQSLGYLGSADFYLGHLEQALDSHEQAAALAEVAGNKQFYGASLQNIGATLTAMGQYEEALFYLSKTLEIGKELNAGIRLWGPLRNIGDLYLHLGDFDEAETTLLQALALTRQYKNQLFEESTLTQLISVPLGRHDYNSALEYARQAAAIDAVLKHPAARYELLNNTAVVYQEMGNYLKAIEMYQQALELAQSSGTTLAEAVISSNIGACQNSLGQSTEALKMELKARDILENMGSAAYPVEESLVGWRIGLIREKLGQVDEALKVFYDSISKIERVRAGAVRTESARAAIGASSSRLFFDTIELLVALKRPAEAFAVAERFRARAFLDLLAEERIDLRQDLTAEQRKNEDTLTTQISAIQKERLSQSVDADRRQQLDADLTAAENALDEFYLELRHDNPRYASLRHAELVSTERVQKELLDSDSALVEFMLGDKHSYALVLSRTNVSAVQLPARKDIEDQVASYRKLLNHRVSALTVKTDLAEYTAASLKLYRTIFEPLEQSLGGSRKLIIAPDGALAYLPFETLSSSNRRQLLLERFQITYVPSASALATLSARTREKTVTRKGLIAFGDPLYNTDINSPKTGGDPTQGVDPHHQERGFEFTQLPYTRYEVESISKLFPNDQSKVYLGVNANEEAVKTANLDQYRYLHFATHALVDDRVPGRSGIVLSLTNNGKEDGILQVGEIMRLRLNAEQVTLSACSTALGRFFEGEGIVGLTRGFLYAGADSVVVSLWNVSDTATAELMRAFYTNLNRGLPRGEALRQAKLKMVRARNLEWTHPYFWAPFVLVGKS
ncbi:MAG TPA: CHAT domain-containing tetratricopeptide repeat protein [Pyrinomonadaceae bacterium]